MSLGEKWGGVMAVGVTFLSGSAYYITKYWIENDDPFSIVNHPFEPVLLKMHILAGPVLIFIFGFLFRSHVIAMIKRRSQPTRKGGIGTAFLFVVAVSSGYLLQTVTMPLFHEALVYVHALGGILFGLVFMFHSLRKKYPGTKAVGALEEETRFVA